MSIIQMVGGGSEWPATPASDPFAANLVLAMPFNTGYAVRDASPKIRGSGSPRVFTQKSPIFTTDSKFYGTSCTIGDPIGSASRFFTSSFSAFSGDFCVESYLKIPSYSAAQIALLRHHNDTNAGPQVIICGDTFADPGARRAIYVNAGGFGSETTYSSLNSLPLNTWFHVAVSRSGTNLRIFIDGQLNIAYGGTLSYVFTFTGTFELMTGPTTIWSTVQIQDYRVYQGVAKYTSNFTPPGPMFI